MKTTDAQSTSVLNLAVTNWKPIQPFAQYSLSIIELKIYEETQRKKRIEKVMNEFQAAFDDCQKSMVIAVNKRHGIVTHMNKIDNNIPTTPGSLESQWLEKLTAQKNKWLSLFLGTDKNSSTFLQALEKDIINLKNLRPCRRTSPILQSLYLKMREIYTCSTDFKALTEEIEFRRTDLNKNKVRLDRCRALFNKEHAQLTQKIADLEESAARIYQDQEDQENRPPVTQTKTLDTSSKITYPMTMKA